MRIKQNFKKLPKIAQFLSW